MGKLYFVPDQLLSKNNLICTSRPGAADRTKRPFLNIFFKNKAACRLPYSTFSIIVSLQREAKAACRRRCWSFIIIIIIPFILYLKCICKGCRRLIYFPVKFYAGCGLLPTWHRRPFPGLTLPQSATPFSHLGQVQNSSCSQGWEGGRGVGQKRWVGVWLVGGCAWA